MNHPTDRRDPTWLAVLDIAGLTPTEYDAVLRRMNVEAQPASGIYLHVAAPLPDDAGIRVIELWNDKSGFESFIQERMLPAASALGLQRETTVGVTPLLNAFVPRVRDLETLPQSRIKPAQA